MAAENTSPSRRRQATRARLIGAAEESFALHGIGGASVEDICERAGFTRGAFYSNFSSKDDLVLAIFDAHTESVLARLEGVTTHSTRRLNDLLDEVFAILTPNDTDLRQWHLVDTELRLHALRHPDLARELTARQQQVNRQLTKFVTRLLQEQGASSSLKAPDLVRVAVALKASGQASYALEGKGNPDSLSRTVLSALITPTA